MCILGFWQNGLLMISLRYPHPPQSIVTPSLLRFEDIDNVEDLFAASCLRSFTTHFFGTLAKGN